MKFSTAQQYTYIHTYSMSLCKVGNQNNLWLFQVTHRLPDISYSLHSSVSYAYDKKVSEEYFMKIFKNVYDNANIDVLAQSILQFIVLQYKERARLPIGQYLNSGK